jgi:hypothetical protein
VVVEKECVPFGKKRRFNKGMALVKSQLLLSNDGIS